MKIHPACSNAIWDFLVTLFIFPSVSLTGNTFFCFLKSYTNTYFSLPHPSTASNTQLVWTGRNWCRPCYGNTSGCHEEICDTMRGLNDNMTLSFRFPGKPFSDIGWQLYITEPQPPHSLWILTGLKATDCLRNMYCLVLSDLMYLNVGNIFVFT